AVLALGASIIQWNFFLTAVHNGKANRHRQIALTFDDGPHPLYTQQVLSQLERHGVSATFFCIGKHVEQFPQLVDEINQRGHVVANHTFTHSATIDFHNGMKWTAEIRQTDDAIERIIHRKPRFFRPPYGVTTPHLARAIRTTGHTVIGWRVRPYDTTARPAQKIVRTILTKTKPGDIILLHDTHDRILPVLEQLLPDLKARGFEMVTVETLLQQHAYIQV